MYKKCTRLLSLFCKNVSCLVRLDSYLCNTFLFRKKWVKKRYYVNESVKFACDALERSTTHYCYAPQVGLDNKIKDAFYDLLNSTVNRVQQRSY